MAGHSEWTECQRLVVLVSSSPSYPLYYPLFRRHYLFLKLIPSIGRTLIGISKLLRRSLVFTLNSLWGWFNKKRGRGSEAKICLEKNPLFLFKLTELLLTCPIIIFTLVLILIQWKNWEMKLGITAEI